MIGLLIALLSLATPAYAFVASEPVSGTIELIYTYPGTLYTITVQRPNGTIAATKYVKAKDGGAITWEYDIPPGSPAGTWTVVVDALMWNGELRRGYGTFEVRP